MASFAFSPQGKFYAEVEHHWGRDPSRFIDDDVLAFNFRAALALSMAKGKPEMDELTDEAARHKELVEQARSRAAGLG